MSPLLVRTSFSVDSESIPDGMTIAEYRQLKAIERQHARVRHALRVNPARTIVEIAEDAYVSEDIVLEVLASDHGLDLE